MTILKVLAICLVTLGLGTLSGCHGPTTFGLMTPLLPVSVITGHSGLLTAGLTGAALLQLKAAAGIAYWLSIRKHRREQKGRGWGWKERHKHRHRRDAETEKGVPISMAAETMSDAELSQFDPSLDEVLQYDQLGCGMRLVCELSATPDAALKVDEKLILELFGHDGKIRNTEKASRGKLSYSYAALLGSHSEDNRICSKVYGRCPYSAPEIMTSIRDVTI